MPITGARGVLSAGRKYAGNHFDAEKETIDLTGKTGELEVSVYY